MYMLRDLAENPGQGLTPPIQRRLRLRPTARTTADRLLDGGLVNDLVFYDWQQHWSSVKPLFARTDVKWASLQLVSGRRESKYHGHEFRGPIFKESEDKDFFRIAFPPLAGDWPPRVKPGVLQPGVFPVLMTSDGWEHGGDGYDKGEFAFAHMPQAERSRLLALEKEGYQRIRAAMEAELSDELSGDETLSDYETDFDERHDLAHEMFKHCVTWLVEQFDDCRLLYSGLDHWLRGKFM